MHAKIEIEIIKHKSDLRETYYRPPVSYPWKWSVLESTSSNTGYYASGTSKTESGAQKALGDAVQRFAMELLSKIDDDK